MKTGIIKINHTKRDIMKELKILLSVFVLFTSSVYAQETEMDYRRSSVYSILINHTEQQFAEEIKNAFMQIPVPDKFNDHNLSVKVLNMDAKLKDASKNRENSHITEFLENNLVASRLVARWFNRDFYTGQCNMELIQERGLYNASEFDRQLASQTALGEAMLKDAGKELIGNTYVLVNDIRYVDKNKGAKAAGSILKVLGSAASIATGYNIDDLTNLVGDMVETIKGFTVRINTFLYRLDWDDRQLYTFYKDHYTARPDSLKRNNFEASRNTYKLKYVAKVESKGSTTSFMGIKEDEPELMVRKACQRAIDENIVELQRSYEDFKIKTPLLTTEPLTAYIGMKEGVDESSRFEVLEVVELEDGTHKYNRVGVIEPIENLIWDNRYMALEEGAVGASLGFTTFKKVSGKDFAKGMLIRELSK